MSIIFIMKRSQTAFDMICEYLNIEPRDFFDFNSDNPEKLNEIIADLKKLPLSNLIIYQR